MLGDSDTRWVQVRQVPVAVGLDRSCGIRVLPAERVELWEGLGQVAEQNRIAAGDQYIIVPNARDLSGRVHAVEPFLLFVLAIGNGDLLVRILDTHII